MHVQNTYFRSIRLSRDPKPTLKSAIFNGVDSFLSQSNGDLIGSSGAQEALSVWFVPSGNSEIGIGAASRSTRNFYQINESLGHVQYQDWKNGSYHHVYRDAGHNFSEHTIAHVIINRPSNSKSFVNGGEGLMSNVYSVGSNSNFSSENFEIGRLLQPVAQNDVYYEGSVLSASIIDGYVDAQQAAALYQLGPKGAPMDVQNLTVKAWYPLNNDFDDHSGNGYHFSSINNVVIG